MDFDSFAALGVVKATTDHDIAGISSIIDDLHALFAQPDLPKEAIVDVLVRLVPTFQHVETGKSLDQKM